MELQGNSGPERAKQTFEQRQRELLDSNRALVRAARAAREDLTSVARERLARTREAQTDSRRDALDLSAAALAASEPNQGEREVRVRELAEAHRMERLHTPERIERAAQRLLEG